MEKNHYLTLDSIISKAHQKSKSSQKEFMKEVVYNLLLEVGYKFNFTATPIEIIPNFVGMNVDVSKNLITDAELHRMGKEWSIGVSPEQTTLFSGATVFTERGRFSLAHEIAHFLLHHISANFPDIAKTYNLDVLQNDHKNCERFCDEISGELLAPAYLFQSGSLWDFIREFTGTGRPMLDISVLESLRKALKISRFVLIQQLHHTRILEDSECGIIISFLMLIETQDDHLLLGCVIGHFPGGHSFQ